MKGALTGLFTITFILVLLASCSANPENAIVGKWSFSTGGEIKTMEFFQDGTFQVVDKKKNPDLFGTKLTWTWETITWGGDYKFIAKNRIKLTDRGLESPNPGGSIVDEISVSPDELILTAPDGTVSNYRKVK